MAKISSDLKSFMVDQMNNMMEAMRVETSTIHREQMQAVERDARSGVAEFADFVHNNREMILKIRSSLQVM